jgi:Domain of unknown function (DUF397)
VSAAEVVTVNGWRKSSHSFANGNCAEVAAWRKSSASHANGSCAEVGQDGAVVGVRDSKDPDGPVLVFGPVAWVAFLAGLRG